MGWNDELKRIAMLLACLPACALESKSLGEDDSASDSGDDDGDDDATVSASDSGSEGGEPLPEAERLWAKTLEDITPMDISIAADGSIWVSGQSGYTYEGGDGGSYASMWFGKFDPAGELIWNAEPGPGFGHIAAIGDGAVVTMSNFEDLAEVRRYGADGGMMWATALDHKADDVVVATDGTIVLGGYRSIDPVGIDSWVAGFDDAGALRWETFYGDVEEGNSAVQAIAAAPDGDVVVVGRHGIAPESSQSQAWLAKISSAGETRWEQTVSDGEATDWITGVDVATDGTIHAIVWAGVSRTVRSYDVAGAELWSWEAAPVDGITGISVAADGSFVLTDGEQLPYEDPEACEAPWGPCPSGMRVARHEIDRSVRWFDAREDCHLGVAAGVQPDDRVIVVGACPPEIGTQEVAMGVFAYGP